MRIRRENKNKDIIVNSSGLIESPDINQSDELQLESLMNDYGIPLMIEMTSRLFKAIVKDFQKSNGKDKTYVFSLMSQDITEDE